MGLMEIASFDNPVFSFYLFDFYFKNLATYFLIICFSDFMRVFDLIDWLNMKWRVEESWIESFLGLFEKEERKVKKYGDIRI